MLASKDEYLQEASNTIFKLSADEQAQVMKQKDEVIQNLSEEIAKLKAQLGKE